MEIEDQESRNSLVYSIEAVNPSEGICRVGFLLNVIIEGGNRKLYEAFKGGYNILVNALYRALLEAVSARPAIS